MAKAWIAIIIVIVLIVAGISSCSDSGSSSSGSSSSGSGSVKHECYICGDYKSGRRVGSYFYCYEHAAWVEAGVEALN